MIYVVWQSNELYLNFHTLPADCFVFPPILVLFWGHFWLFAFSHLVFCSFLPTALVLCSVITSRRLNRHPGSTFQLAENCFLKTESWRSRELVTASRDPTYASPNVRSGGPRWDQMGGGGLNFHPKLLPLWISKWAEVRYCSSPSLGGSWKRTVLMTIKNCSNFAQKQG